MSTRSEIRKRFAKVITDDMSPHAIRFFEVTEAGYVRIQEGMMASYVSMGIMLSIKSAEAKATAKRMMSASEDETEDRRGNKDAGCAELGGKSVADIMRGMPQP